MGDQIGPGIDDGQDEHGPANHPVHAHDEFGIMDQLIVTVGLLFSFRRSFLTAVYFEVLFCPSALESQIEKILSIAASYCIAALLLPPL